MALLATVGSVSFAILALGYATLFLTPGVGLFVKPKALGEDPLRRVKRLWAWAFSIGCLVASVWSLWTGWVSVFRNQH